jgi:lipoprotein NlpD
MGSLVACGGHTYAPVSERAVPAAIHPNTAEYIVKKGDTLYSIAFRYGMDYRQLAALNGIGSHYSIYPGQPLRLKPATVPSKESIVRDSSIVAPKPIITSTRQTVAANKPVSKPKPQSQTATKTPIKSTAKPSSSTAKPPVKTTTTNKKPEIKTTSSGKIYWKWPTNGKVLNTFKTSGVINKGIDIAGSRGLAIKAAASGKVVYAGNGLLGYGNLVIIDHNQQFLSAYAHNSRVLVKENDMVKTGQKIAEMGSSGADRVMLHFEIRRDGKPVDPLRYLPKR